MRHVWSLLAGLAVAPAVIAVLSVTVLPAGQAEFALQTGVLVAAGLLLGVLASLRLSPVGPIVAGLLLVTPRILASFRVGDWLFRSSLLPRGTIADGVYFRPELALFSPIAFAGGVILLMAAASPGRWKQWPKPGPAGAPVEPVVDTGRIESVAAWRPFPDDTSEATISLDVPRQQPGTTSELPLTGPWAPPPPQR